MHPEILDNYRIQFLKKLAPEVPDFILGGGTALALQIGHRKSFDFDFFTAEEISSQLVLTIKSIIDIKTVAVNTISELTIFDQNDIKCTFLSYPFKPQFPYVSYEKIRLFDVRDIVLHKAYVIGRRGEWRDYVDLYVILIGGYIEFKEVIHNAEIVYGSLFNPKLFLQQLVYFKDIQNFELESVTNVTLPERDALETYFSELANKYIES